MGFPKSSYLVSFYSFLILSIVLYINIIDISSLLLTLRWNFLTLKSNPSLTGCLPSSSFSALCLCSQSLWWLSEFWSSPGSGDRRLQTTPRTRMKPLRSKCRRHTSLKIEKKKPWATRQRLHLQQEPVLACVSLQRTAWPVVSCAVSICILTKRVKSCPLF